MSGIWQRTMSLAELNALCASTLVQHLGIEFTQLNEDSLEAQLVVATHHCQPAGILHGGVNGAVAETLTSAGALLTLPEDKAVAGIELCVNHLQPVPNGALLTAKAWPLRLGGRTQVWQCDLFYGGKLSATARVTLAVILPR